MTIDRSRLIRYFQRECSDDEKEDIHQWLESDESHKKEFVRERIRFDASLVIDEDRFESQRTNRRLLQIIGQIAAVILLLVGSNYLFGLYQKKTFEPTLQTVHVPAGSRTSLTLPDGTLVWLNSNTTFTYPNVFTDDERAVALNGEAYFEVTEDKKKRFIVKTDVYNIEVLGTTFNVEAYKQYYPGFKAALFSGKIMIYKDSSNEEESVYLNPGETATWSDHKLLVSVTNPGDYKWREGLISISNKSFEEMMQLFEKYYGYRIIIENEKVKDLGYHGKLRVADGIDHALRVLQNDFQFTYKKEEETNSIYIY